jgi:hypothetical protein
MIYPGMAELRIYVGGQGPVHGGGVAPINPVPDVSEQRQLLEEVKAARKESKRKRKAEELDRLATEREGMMERVHARKVAKRKRKVEAQDRVDQEREHMQWRAREVARLHSEQMYSLVKDLIKIGGDVQRGNLP